MFKNWNRRSAQARRCGAQSQAHSVSRPACEVEVLEKRALLSGSSIEQSLAPGAGRGVLSEAAALGAFQFHSKKTLSGKVGTGDSDVVYKIDVTAPINLSVQLSNLKQKDQLNLLFKDGSVITSATNGRAKTLKFSQRLDPGTYYIDLFNGINSGVGAAKAKAKKYHFKSTGAFKLLLKGLKPDSTTAPQAPVKAPGGALRPSAGFGVEPGVDTTIVNHWID
ncbi:MAG: hypothetical protein JWN51_1041, partial [Phycisphaerales bacterium]|nr:hypothetical protein [Phycisphaerales bacterium]